jgi:hypothetical protein
LYNGTSGSVTSLYTEYYRGIDRVNRTLEGMEKLTFTGADLTLANRYKGELLALRAYFILSFYALMQLSTSRRFRHSLYEAAAVGYPRKG